MYTLQPGAFLQGGRYKIIQTLGRGSFGITYLAMRTSLEQKVCIKEFFMKDINFRNDDGTITGITDGSLSFNYAKKFRREAANLSSLNHPNIVRVTDLFDENGSCYYVMEYIEGEDLNTYVKHHVCSEQEATTIIKDIASALQYMHEEKHMLHLDLKPGNVMRRATDGHVFVIDFGLSKYYNENGEPETSTIIGLGTPGYAPIEQINQNKNGEFRPTIDVYALGGTFYKLLTGETPPTMAEIVADGDLLSYTLQKHNVSENLSYAVVHSMELSSRTRTQSVTEFLTTLSARQSAHVRQSTPVKVSRAAEETIAYPAYAEPQNSKLNKKWLWIIIAAVFVCSAIVAAITQRSSDSQVQNTSNVIPSVPIQEQEESAATPEPATVYDFPLHMKGNVGGYAVTMDLKQDGSVYGTYYYARCAHTIMSLTEISYDGTNLSLEETDPEEGCTGRFDGYFSNDKSSYSGTFTRYKDDKTFTFSLRAE